MLQSSHLPFFGNIRLYAYRRTRRNSLSRPPRESDGKRKAKWEGGEPEAGHARREARRGVRKMRRAPRATHAATCAATTPNTACTVALELTKADAPRPKRQLSPRRLPVGGAAARTHRLRVPYPRKRLLPADWPYERNVPRASNARRTRPKAPRTHRRTSGDTEARTRGEPHRPRR